MAQNLSTGTGVAVQFLGSATAGNAAIAVNSGTFLQFIGTSSGGTARVINNGSFALETSSGALTIGSLEGTGIVLASTNNGGAATNILTVGSQNTSTTFSGVLGDGNLVGSANFGLTKVGTGTLTLSGSSGSRYVLTTTVSAGTLQAGATNAFSDDSAYSVANGATLDLNGFSQVIGSLTGVAGANVTLGAGTLTAGGDGTTTAYAGSISGSGGLTKQGTGTLTLSGTNTYSGATIVSTGEMRIANSASASDDSAFRVAAGATLTLHADAALGSLADQGGGGGTVALAINLLSPLVATLTIGNDNTST